MDVVLTGTSGEMAIPMPQKVVEVIPANPRLNKYTGEQADGIIDVCAYARVSTDSEDQLNSYNAQKEFYEQKIKENPDWNFAGIFADEGITGTSLNKRKHFNQMIRQCRHGKIKLILCKSVSRFARNTVDCLNIVRELKALGIAVYFEKENVNTLKESSEFLLTLFSGFAQAESESLSANVIWGKRKSMQDGNVIFQYKKLLGYTKGEDGKPVVVPEEANIIIRIYREYLAGYSLKRIMEGLIQSGIASPSEKGWSRQSISNILKNEKYVGDALLQKTYRMDCISKQVRKNNGELPMYLVKNNHEAIISRELFNRVQEEMSRRAGKRTVDTDTGRTKQGKFSSKYALTERLVCGECGTRYRRCTWTERSGEKKVVWRCISRLSSGRKFCKDSPTIEEGRLHDGIMRALNQVLSEKEDIIRTLRHSLATSIGGDEYALNIPIIEKRLKELTAQRDKLMSQLGSEPKKEAQNEMTLIGLTKELQDLREKLLELQQNQEIMQRNNAHISEVFKELEDAPRQLCEYDDRLTASVIEQITVLSDEEIRVKMIALGIEADVAL
ncbi:recombinase family protein [Clostridia bacterium OttesenSCG-928-F22]|nr:recombinase family protein [Clostridia bacterium OttesenSCG-928-F22]